MCEFN